MIRFRFLLFATGVLFLSVSGQQAHAQDCRNGGRLSNPSALYVAHTIDWGEWIVQQMKPYIPNNDNFFPAHSGRVQTYMYVTNGSARPAKVRLTALTASGTLAFEADRCIDSGHSAALIAADLLAPWALLGAEVFIISSNEPLLIDSYTSLYGRQIFTGGGNVADATLMGDIYAKRTIDFHEISCKEKGREFFCAAPTSVTPWAVDAGPPPDPMPWEFE